MKSAVLEPDMITDEVKVRPMEAAATRLASRRQQVKAAVNTRMNSSLLKQPGKKG